MRKKQRDFRETAFLVLLNLLLLGYPFICLLAVSIPSDNLSVDIFLSDEKYQIGNRGTITIELLNRTSKDISTQSVISLPTNFLNGFIIDYSGSCSLHKGIIGFNQRLVCKIIIPANTSSSFTFTITPYQEGNYEGTIEVNVQFWKTLLLRYLSASVPFNVSVLPK